MGNEMNSGEIIELLKKKYALPAWALVTEVPNGTSIHRSRALDAMALGCWKSEGLEVLGFEIKVSRSDWQRELQDPSKSKVFSRYCHRFFIVAPKGIVEIGEMPREWGLIVATEKGLTIKSASSLAQPEPLPLNMMAAMLRRVLTMRDREQRNSEAYKKGFAEARELTQRDIDHAEAKFETLHRKVRDFELASGMGLDRFGGKAVRVEHEQFEQFKKFIKSRELAIENLETIAHYWRILVDRAQEGLATIDSLTPFLAVKQNEETAAADE